MFALVLYESFVRSAEWNCRQTSTANRVPVATVSSHENEWGERLEVWLGGRTSVETSEITADAVRATDWVP